MFVVVVLTSMISLVFVGRREDLGITFMLHKSLLLIVLSVLTLTIALAAIHKLILNLVSIELLGSSLKNKHNAELQRKPLPS